MPEFFGWNLALAASDPFFAIGSRRSGSDRRGVAHSRISAPSIGAHNHAFADVIDAGEFPRRSIGIEVNRGFGEYAAEDLTSFGVKFDLFAGWERDNVARARANNRRQIVSRKKMEDAVHEPAESKLFVPGRCPIRDK